MRKTFILVSLLILITCCMNQQKNSKIYICTGKYATKYHRSLNCSGLNRCQSQVIAIN